MTQLAKTKNGSELFPFLRNDFLANKFFTSYVFDFDDDFFNASMTVPPANITDTNDDFRVNLSVPYMKIDDFKVDIKDGILIISSEKGEESRDYKRKEFSCSSFSRCFTLPDDADENNINAKYDNGMLQITIPKKKVTVSKSKKRLPFPDNKLD